MIEKLIYFSPLAAIIIGVLCLLRINQKDSDIRRCFHTARISLTISFILSVIFFNRSSDGWQPLHIALYKFDVCWCFPFDVFLRKMVLINENIGKIILPVCSYGSSCR